MSYLFDDIWGLGVNSNIFSDKNDANEFGDDEFDEDFDDEFDDDFPDEDDDDDDEFDDDDLE